MEKQLIFYDEKSATKEIEGRKLLISAIKDLILVFNSLNLRIPFSKEIFIGLVEVGRNYLVKYIWNSIDGWLKESNAPSIIYGSLNFEPDWTAINEPLLKVKTIMVQYKLDPYKISFEGCYPVLTEEEVEKIKEGCKYYIKTPVQNELYQLVQNYCKAINRLEKFVKQNNKPSIIESSFSADTLLYVDFLDNDQEVSLIPNPLMFSNLRL
jgi:hypothetical protein